LIAAFVLAAQVAVTPIPVTLDRLVATPDKFAGARVKLTGQIDACLGLSCKLCPTTAKLGKAYPSSCLGIEFARTQPKVSYSDVVLTGRFDPACLRGACLDNETVLTDVVVEAVLRERR